MLIVDGQKLEIPGLRVRSYADDPAHVNRFPAHGRRTRVTEVVLHETVTTSVAATVATLVDRHLSVHLIVGPDGEMTQHGDLMDVLWHAGKHNAASFGVEVVNPYYGKLLRKPWEQVIHAPWAGGFYVLPTPAQAEAVALLVDWCTQMYSADVWDAGGPPAEYGGVQIPPRWVGKDEWGRFAFCRVPAAKRPTPGVLAHHYWEHSDGAWLALYSWLRVVVGMDPETAYAEALRRATGQLGHVSTADLVVPPAAQQLAGYGIGVEQPTVPASADDEDD